MISQFDKNMMTLIYSTPIEREFNIPAGNYRARLSSIAEPTDKLRYPPGTTVRLVFDLSIPSLDEVIPTAVRNFEASLADTSDLRQFIESWLGVETLTGNDRGGFNLNSLIGREADLKLIHIENENRPNPYVYIHSAYPAGSLALTDQPWDIDDDSDQIADFGDNNQQERKAA